MYRRPIAVDTQGLPDAVAVTTAEVTDRNGSLAAIDRCQQNLGRVESVLVDGGRSGQPFAEGIKERLRATVQVVKRNELHTIVGCPNDGLSNALLRGWRSAADCGRTVSGS